MIPPEPVTLEGHGVRLEPLAPEHAEALAAAAGDGALWELWFTSVPRPEEVAAWITTARQGHEAGHMLPWAVRDANTACELLLLEHAFETLGCRCVGFRTDAFNFPSRRAIAALGAREDGVLRHHRPRRDGTVRDTVVFSIVASEWPEVRRHLELRLVRSGPSRRPDEPSMGRSVEG